MKQNIVDALILSANIKPKFIVENIMSLAIFNNPKVKIICVPELDEKLDSILGFKSCLCLAFFDIAKNAQYQNLWNWLEICGQRFIKAQLEMRQIIFPLISNKTALTAKSVEPKTKSKLSNYKTISIDDFIVKKPSEKNERGYLPENAKEKKKSAVQNEWTDFISLNSDISDTQFIKKPETSKKFGFTTAATKNQKRKPIGPASSQFKKGDSLFKYNPLKINKIQSNPNKLKRNRK